MKKSDSVTYYCFIQDHSGSMSNKKQLAINNFNEQIATLLKEDDNSIENLISIVEFDDDINCNIDGVELSKIEKMESWWLGGMTSLYDAIGYGIEIIEKKLKNDTRKDKAAIIIVQTDGEENSSSKYKGEEGRINIKKKIDDLEATKIWTFTFLGENIDKSVAMDMGFKLGNIMNHKSDLNSVHNAYYCVTSNLSEYAQSRKAGMTQTMSFYDKEEENDDNDPGRVAEHGNAPDC